jgi:predicted site-specific integrase-resolvase
MSIELEDKIKDLEKQIAYLQSKNNYYEQDGVGKLYYSLQRKANEMADLLNDNKLTSTMIEDPKDKTFDRLQKIWTDAESVSTAIKSLGVIAGIGLDTKEEKKEVMQVNKKPFSPENMADAVGELAGKRY